MRTVRAQRGFTLVELMVASTIGALVMVGVSAAFIGQARQYQAQAGRRSSQAAARTGLSFIEDRLRLAGYGVDPNLAIEAWDSYDASTDSLAGATDFPDAIAVHYRDLDFKRQITSATVNQINFATPLTQAIPKGTIVLAVCPAASATAYGVVTAKANIGATQVSVGSPGVATPSPITMPSNRWDTTANLTKACFGAGEAMLVKVERYAFFVASFDDDGKPSTADVPYLMLHRGVDLNGDGAVDLKDAQPVAAAVEQLQTAYVLNTLSTQPPKILGVTAATRVPAVLTWDSAATRPSFDKPYLDPDDATNANWIRFQSNPANIRQVRVTLISRSEAPSGAAKGDAMSTPAASYNKQVLSSGVTAWTQLENLASVANPKFDPNAKGFVRTVMRTSVTTKNLMMRTQFLPPYNGG